MYHNRLLFGKIDTNTSTAHRAYANAGFDGKSLHSPIRFRVFEEDRSADGALMNETRVWIGCMCNMNRIYIISKLLDIQPLPQANRQIYT